VPVAGSAASKTKKVGGFAKPKKKCKAPKKRVIKVKGKGKNKKRVATCQAPKRKARRKKR
jgi:hypothetical protein